MIVGWDAPVAPSLLATITRCDEIQAGHQSDDGCTS